MIDTIEPYDDRMLIELLPPQEVTEGGIILPEAYRGRDAQRDAAAREGADPRREVVVARVLTVGPGRPLDTHGRRFPMATQRGDIVLVGGYAGIEVRVGRRDDLKIVRETDIVARLRRNGAAGYREEERSAEARDQAIDRVEKNAPEDWKHRVRVAIEALCKERQEISADDVWERLELLRIDLGRAESRALGALMKQAQAAGWIEPTSTFKNSERVACHRRPLRVWISTIYRSAPPLPAGRQGRLDF